jgi:cytochrome c biogenesis protein CcmG, thiol:disulfide interchange protein DsbE
MTRKQLAIIVLVVALLVALLAAGKSLLRNELSPVGVGTDAPDFAVMTLDSVAKRKTLDDYRGDVVMINIWATWCAPCRIEMPAIEQLHRAYSSKGLKILAISVDEPGSEPEIRSFVKEYGLTFEVLHDPGGQEGKVSRDYQTTGYPETVIIGRDGIIRKKLLGAHDWNSAENRALIDRLLAEKAD